MGLRVRPPAQGHSVAAAAGLSSGTKGWRVDLGARHSGGHVTLDDEPNGQRHHYVESQHLHIHRDWEFQEV